MMERLAKLQEQLAETLADVILVPLFVNHNRLFGTNLGREFPNPPHKTKKAVCFLSPPRIKVKKAMGQNPNTKRNLTPVFDAAAATEGVGH